MSDKVGLTQLRLPVAEFDSIRLSSISAVSGWTDGEQFFAFREKAGSRFVFDRMPEVDFVQEFDIATPATASVSRLEELLGGKFRFFSDRVFECGLPPDWHLNYFSQVRGPSKRHFSKISDFEFGDIKAIWELSRFSFVFELIRIHARTGDPRCSELFWMLFDDWCRKNPSNSGVNWKCGQEAALRAIATVFGVWIFGRTRAATRERLETVTRLMHETANRIEKYLGYALTQKNNHAISEGAGLFVIGCLFPELKQASHWRDLGKRVIETQTLALFFDDGGFVQYSSNYHRLAIQLLTFCQALARSNQISLSSECVDRIRHGIAFMASWVDLDTGGAPRFGNDDGSLLFPLSNQPYDDYRPALQAACAVFNETLSVKKGPWDEEIVWMGGNRSRLVDSPVERRNLSVGQGSVGVLHGQNSRAVFLCHDGRFRPAQLDLFHVDIWYHGLNLAIDPGTYSYNATGKYANTPFALAAYHNTVLLNCREPAQRVGKFLFDPWPSGKAGQFIQSPDRQTVVLQAVREDRFTSPTPTIHRRALVGLSDNRWIIIDHVKNSRPISNRLHWLLHPMAKHSTQIEGLVLISDSFAYGLRVMTNPQTMTSSLAAACELSPRGWQSERYLSCTPAKSLEVISRAATSCYFVSVFSPVDAVERAMRQSHDGAGEIELVWRNERLVINLQPQGSQLISQIRGIGNHHFELVV